MGVRRASSTKGVANIVEEPPLGYPPALRGEVWWVDLDPTVGSEIRKRRPAVVVSPDDMNLRLRCVIVAPLTSQGRALGCRPEVRFKGKRGRILLDQIRSIDRSRLVSPMGKIDETIWKPVLLEMLA